MPLHARRYFTLCVAGFALVCATSLAQGEDLTLQGLRALIGRQFPDVPFIDADALVFAMQGEAAGRPRLLDTRTPQEYSVSHLRGATRLDPDAIDLSVAGKDKSALIVVYCSVGYRSAAVGQRLRRAGFKDVKNLAGGIFGWANSGHPVYQGTNAVRQVHPYDAVWGALLNADLRKRSATP